MLSAHVIPKIICWVTWDIGVGVSEPTLFQTEGFWISFRRLRCCHFECTTYSSQFLWPGLGFYESFLVYTRHIMIFNQLIERGIIRREINLERCLWFPNFEWLHNISYIAFSIHISEGLCFPVIFKKKILGKFIAYFKYSVCRLQL